MAAKKAPKARHVLVAHVRHHGADAARFHEHKKTRNTARQLGELRRCNNIDAIRRKIIQRIPAHPQRLHQGQRQRPQYRRGHPKSNPSGRPKQEGKQDHTQHFKQGGGSWAALSVLRNHPRGATNRPAKAAKCSQVFSPCTRTHGSP